MDISLKFWRDSFALLCGGELALRQGRFGMFIGCSRYPECEHTEQIDKPDETAMLALSVSAVSWYSAVPYGKTFIPAIATLIASSLSILNR
jgi:ssDNA-binding Zn-finger/Zn-ribbon topoisomerase 1